MGKIVEKGLFKMSKTIKEQCKQYQLRHAAGKYYLLDMEQPGMPYKRPMELNEIGAEIWQMMAEGCGVEQVVAQLAKEYDAEEVYIREDVLQFQKSLLAYGVEIGE